MQDSKYLIFLLSIWLQRSSEFIHTIIGNVDWIYACACFHLTFLKDQKDLHILNHWHFFPGIPYIR